MVAFKDTVYIFYHEIHLKYNHDTDVYNLGSSTGGWVKSKTIKLLFVASLLSTHHYGERAKTGGLGIRIMCQSGSTCFSELALLKSN